jgi:glucose-1-phosphate cytidylyltransferase
MKIVILCGGSGTRLREMTSFLPKPLIPIGGKPFIWHIMKLYSHYGFNEFVLALGYKQEMFKEYFIHYNQINEDITVDTGICSALPCYSLHRDKWRVTLSDTGLNTMKGARLKRVEKYVDGDNFMCTYGDSVGDINIPELLAFHKSHGKMVTVTGVHSPPRFGEIHHENNKVISFSEKPQNGNFLINGGYFVFNRKIFDHLYDFEECDLEVGTLELIANKGEMMVYHHKQSWFCMDNLKDMDELNQLWNTGKAPWRIWNV